MCGLLVVRCSNIFCALRHSWRARCRNIFAQSIRTLSTAGGGGILGVILVQVAQGQLKVGPKFGRMAMNSAQHNPT